jgi:putative sigma-54 modulation protein
MKELPDAKVSVTFRHMDHSPVLDAYAQKELAKLAKFLESEKTPIFIEFVLEAQRTHHHHRAELRVKTPNYTLNAHKESPDMYLAIDAAVDAMVHELGKAKRKLVDDHKRGGFSRPG